MDRHAVLIERQQDRLGLYAPDPETQHVRQRSVAESLDVADEVEDRRRPLDEGGVESRPRPRGRDGRGRGPEADPGRDVLDPAGRARSWAPPTS